MDDYIFNHHTFILVQLNYLKGNQSFFHYSFIQKTYLLKIYFLGLLQLLLAFFSLWMLKCKRYSHVWSLRCPISCLGMRNSKLPRYPSQRYYDNLKCVAVFNRILYQVHCVYTYRSLIGLIFSKWDTNSYSDSDSESLPIATYD